MRRIGTLSDRGHAERFCDYLMTLSIDASADEDTDEQGPTWHIWIRDEKHVSQARDELAAFQASPHDEKYQVGDQANQIRDQRVADHQRRLKQQRNFGQSMSRQTAMGGPLAGAPVKQQNIPFTITFIVLSVLASFGSDFSKLRPQANRGEFSLNEKIGFTLAFADKRDYVKSGDPFEAIKRGEVWRLFTPMLLHGNTMHLAFNMYMFFVLGSVLERLHGSLFMAILVMLTGLAGTLLQVMLPPAEALPPLLQGLGGTPFAIGASGAVYGLFGFLWIRPLMDPNYPIRMVPFNVVLLLGWLVFCMTPAMPHVANGAHVGGLIAGVIAACIPIGRSD